MNGNFDIEMSETTTLFSGKQIYELPSLILQKPWESLFI